VHFPAYEAKKGTAELGHHRAGFTKGAYLKAAVFTRASAQKTQREAIKLIEDLELEERRGQQAGGPGQGGYRGEQELLARRALIVQLKKTRAKGRVIINRSQRKVEGTLGCPAEDGDRLDVPKKMNGSTS
jgi:hypothetical protein